MNDLISRAAALEAVIPLQTYKMSESDDMLLVNRADVQMELMMLPAAQPEIIACGDCKHWICHDRRCGFWNHGVKPLDWCCHAERRTDERSD